MLPFTNFSGLVAPLRRSNVDTDAILPKQFMKTITRTGLGAHLFDEWRYADVGELGQDCTRRPLRPDFVLNSHTYKCAHILLVGENFGCGSSREHAVWALADFGIRVLIGASFAEIFLTNCLKNGIVPISLEKTVISKLFDIADTGKSLRIHVDLASQVLTSSDHSVGVVRFEFDSERKRRLLYGLDDIAVTLQFGDRIRAYENNRRDLEPWLYLDSTAGE